MKREDAIANLKMIRVAFVDPVTAEQAKLIDDTFDLAIKALKQEPPEATWKGVEYDGYAGGWPVYDVWECTQCGYEHHGESDTLTDYCPGCGAKMAESEDK